MAEQRGYIAITSAIVISILIITIVLASNFRGFSGRYNISDSYYKEVSRSLSEACVETAILELSKNPLYTGNQTISVGSDQCSIMLIDVILLPPQRVIKTKAIFNKAVTNLKVVINPLTLEIVSWEELPNL